MIKLISIRRIHSISNNPGNLKLCKKKQKKGEREKERKIHNSDLFNLLGRLMHLFDI